MKWRKLKLAITFIGALSASYLALKRLNRPYLENYVEANLESIIREQEQVLGIKHKGIPKINIIEAEHFFEQPASYDPIKGIINLRTDFFMYPRWLLRKILFHELGHHYMREVRKQKGINNYAWNWFYINEGNLVGRRLIEEGTATYFAKRTMGSSEDTFSDEEWPTNEKGNKWTPFCGGISFNSVREFLYCRRQMQIYYNGGYHLVKPIIDKYGSRGIEYLVTHLLINEELSDIRKYQERILKGLSQTSN